MSRSLAILVALALVAPASAAPQRELAVAAASDLTFAMDELVAEFRKGHPDITFKLSYGSSGNFFAQLRQKAPFDLFFSADADYPRRLQAEGHALPDSLFLYAAGRLAVWVPRSSGVDLAGAGMKALLAPEIKKVAIANPRHAPYGRAAEAALRHAGIYERIQAKLVFGENVAQAAQFAQSGAADAAIIGHALALAPAMQSAGRYWEVPLGAYPRMDQAGLILKWAKDAAAARAFREHVLGPHGSGVLKRWGFLLPSD